jgi:hypothetical protein
MLQEKPSAFKKKKRKSSTSKEVSVTTDAKTTVTTHGENERGRREPYYLQP